MESSFNDLGLKTVINASGKMTVLGSSILSETVSNAIKDASQDYVNIEEFIRTAGSIIADHTGAEDGCPTNSASSGMTISVAALLAKKNLVEIESIPFINHTKNEFILQAGHDINFGADIKQTIRVGGGNVKLVGAVNEVQSSHIVENIDENTAGIIYVKSHHTTQKGMVSLEETIKISEEYNIPVIVDAAAEKDLTTYINMGADVVVYSGSKALEGPTSGFICGKKHIMEACREQYKGIGRLMKVSKEGIAGLIASLNQYENLSSNPQEQKQEMEKLSNKLNQLHGLSCEISKDEAGREIYRASIKVKNNCYYTASELSEKLQNGNPAIYLRNYYANTGQLFVDPRPLKEGQIDFIIDRFYELLNKS